MAASSRVRDGYGLQAQFDWWALRGMMRHMDVIVPHTFLPALRLLSADPESVDQAYQALVAQREPIRLWDSPRVKWAKRYGAYVRELEWVSRGLQQHMSKEDYERFVVDTVARQIEAWIGGLKPRMHAAMSGARGRAGEGAEAPPAGERLNGLLSRLTEGLLGALNFGGFLVGPMTLSRFDAARGMSMYIPSCAMHTVVSETEPQTESCLRSCKGACEQVFGPASPLRIHFEPHLPSLDCTMKITWDGSAPAAFEDEQITQLRRSNRQLRAQAAAAP